MADKMLENNEKARQHAKEIFDLVRKIAAELHAEHHRPAVRFALEPGEPGIFESKAGGTPYLPRDMAWPLDGRGCAMGLLAQVDCAGLAGLPDFPTAGLLQFFIGLDDVWGIDFDDQVSQKNFRVLYHETVDHSVTAGEVEARRPPLPEDKDFGLPLCDGPCRIILKAPSEQGINGYDPRFDPMFTEKWNRARPDLQIERVWKLYSLVPDRLRDYSAADQPGWEAPFHQIGGYPYFTQNDPREEKPEYKDFDTLLFQLDSDGAGKRDLVLWGDCGIANFFISREALKRRDFSRVCYNWDCC